MSVPEHLWRYPTAAAVDSLARRFGFPNTPDMQDWEWEVADAARIDEFLAAYESGELDDDERFTLMETILQSFEDLGESLSVDPRWPRVLELLDRNVDLHAYTVFYWSCLENEDDEDSWLVTPYVRRVLERHRSRLKGA